jgi:hypothetical protein
MQLDIVLLVVLAAVAVWTEVDKLRSRNSPGEEEMGRPVTSL